MRIAFVLVSLGAVVMAAALVFGFTQGDGWREVGVLMDFPWFVVSLVDVYVGFALFAGWIIYRDRPLPIIIWIVLLLTLGNLIACLYVLLALSTARGSAARFWLGHRATVA